MEGFEYPSGRVGGIVDVPGLTEALADKLALAGAELTAVMSLTRDSDVDHLGDPDGEVLFSLLNYTSVAPSPNSYGGSAIHAKAVYGDDAHATHPVGTIHSLVAQTFVESSGNAGNEFAAAFIGMEGLDVGRYWLIDSMLHGPIDVAPNLLQGVSLVMRNRNAGAIASGSFGHVICTMPGAGDVDSDPTWPIGVGLAIVGRSDPILGDGDYSHGFDTGLQIGGSAGGWMAPGASSSIGTGIVIQDCSEDAIRVTNESGFVNVGAGVRNGIQFGNVIRIRVNEGGTDVQWEKYVGGEWVLA